MIGGEDPFASSPENQDSFPAIITRPDRALLPYYIITTLMTGPAFPILILPRFFKYHTMRFRFDNSGVAMSWGLLFRREINLTYRRIQDIHLTRNLLQRWMGLATVTIQTASGGSGPEMRIEGVLAAQQLRDFLYSKMRGAEGEPAGGEGPESTAEPEPAEKALELLHEIRDILRQQRAGGGS